MVINGLARGGTNLAANLFAGQKKWHASDAAIAEISCVDAFLPKDFINRYSQAIGNVPVSALINSNIEKFKSRCIERMVQTVCPSYHTIKTKYHSRIESYYGIDMALWGRYLSDVAAIKTFNDLDPLYQAFGKAIACDVLAHRTTALTSYAAAFIARSDKHYWIEVIRDPYDRAVSSRKGHAQSCTQSFLQSKWQLDQLKTISTDRLIKLNYEDLCRDAEQSVIKVCAQLGVPLEGYNPLPVTPDMSCFYGNSSANPDIFNQVEKKSAIYTDSIGGGSVLSERERRLGEKILSGASLSIAYRAVLLVADGLYHLGKLMQKASLAVLAFNYLAILSRANLRKVGQRCMARFE